MYTVEASSQMMGQKAVLNEQTFGWVKSGCFIAKPVMIVKDVYPYL